MTMQNGQVCASVIVTSQELDCITRHSNYRRHSEQNRSLQNVWSLERFLSPSEFRLIYRIVELGGSIAVVCSQDINAFRVATQNGRIRLHKEFLPKALTDLHIEETKK